MITDLTIIVNFIDKLYQSGELETIVEELVQASTKRGNVKVAPGAQTIFDLDNMDEEHDDDIIQEVIQRKLTSGVTIGLCFREKQHCYLSNGLNITIQLVGKLKAMFKGGKFCKSPHSEV